MVGQKNRTGGTELIFLAGSLVFFGGDCRHSQSLLLEAGEESKRIGDLMRIMLIGGAMIWVVMVALLVFAVIKRRPLDPAWVRRWVIGGGVGTTTIILGALLVYGLSTLGSLQKLSTPTDLTVRVSGVRWWWRIEYEEEPRSDSNQGLSAELANEIWLPVGETIAFDLTSEDVIHSFWIPALGGKVDMIPGRSTRLVLNPTRKGTFRGVCAEYCGEAHTQMGFVVRVVDRLEFNDWLARQRSPAALEESPSPGFQTFLRHGCSACHSIRGTSAKGRIGPDLTHVGSRLSLAGGWLANSKDQLGHWLTNTELAKPGVEMPSFRSFEPEELDLMASFLESLK